MYQQDPDQIHVMIDLETLGTEGSPVILSIGAVKFTAREVLDTFHVHILPKSCTDRGLTIDPDTVMWWLAQSAEARAAVIGDPETKVALPQALLEFSMWMGVDGPVWGNGASTDNVWLTNAYNACGMTPPWSFWNDRCYRTIRMMFPDISAPPSLLKHDALEDARAQALHMITLMPLLP